MLVEVCPLSDVRAYMGHADIQTMFYFYHVPADDAAGRLSLAVRQAEDFPALRTARAGAA